MDDRSLQFFLEELQKSFNPNLNLDTNRRIMREVIHGVNFLNRIATGWANRVKSRGQTVDMPKTDKHILVLVYRLPFWEARLALGEHEGSLDLLRQRAFMLPAGAMPPEVFLYNKMWNASIDLMIEVSNSHCEALSGQNRAIAA